MRKEKSLLATAVHLLKSGSLPDFSCNAAGIGAVCFGENATAKGNATSAFGSNATANGSGATAFGTNAKAFDRATAIGAFASATGDDAIALGVAALARLVIAPRARSLLEEKRKR